MTITQKLKRCAFIAVLAVVVTQAPAHDTWVEPNVPIVRVGDVAHLALFLGNHGNDHRDFKVAGKMNLDGTTWTVTGPDGASTDLKATALDRGLSAKEGFWNASFLADKPGLYTVVQRSDRVVDYAPTRSVKVARTFVLASKSLDRVDPPKWGAESAPVASDGLELVPLTHPVAPLGPGSVVRMKVLFKGQPLQGARVSFIPRGAVLKEGFDPRYERTTGPEGEVGYEVTEPTVYLAVVHHETDEKGPGYTATKYSATVCLFVPAVCPCCGE